MNAGHSTAAAVAPGQDVAAAAPTEEALAAEFRADVLTGLAAPRKAIPPKWFYDFEGSRLFEQICELPEYYPTRTELGILRDHAEDMAEALGEGVVLVEFGAGALVKVRLLLDALRNPAAFVPIDISADHLVEAADGLARDYPGLRIVPVGADYMRPFVLPPVDGRKVGFFPGSTIGNLPPKDAVAFLAQCRDLLGGGPMVVGVDLRKDREVLERAYDDSAGVTAAFNLNLLRRINRELDGNFQVDRFRHLARWNDEAGRIEMHLESRVDQRVRVAGASFAFTAGETIFTESSYKYTREGFRDLAAAAGYGVDRVWSDANSRFSVHLLR